jgi:cytochrome b6-f complex iron-sulfur subunit
MAEQKKMTTAEILAMARQKAAGAKGGNAPTFADEPPAPASAEAAAETPAAPAAPAEATKPAPVTAGGARPSVADILAAARAAKGGAAPTATPAAGKPAAEKPAAKPAVEKKTPAAAAAESPADKTGPAVRDTASILAAARKATKPGPMSKAEAEASGAAVAPAVKVKPVVPPAPAKPDIPNPKVAVAQETRRGFLDLMLGSFLGIGFTAMASVGGLWSLGLARFMFPNILTEPPSRFKVGFPESFTFGQVEEKFKAQFGVWVVNGEFNGQRELYALKSVCTHLGCTPNWLDAEQKFKCPCHGSGFYKDGINFEGPAPRPLERYAVKIADDGQVEIDKSRTFQEELGQWSDPASFIPRSA